MNNVSVQSFHTGFEVFEKRQVSRWYAFGFERLGITLDILWYSKAVATVALVKDWPVSKFISSSIDTKYSIYGSNNSTILNLNVWAAAK